QSWPGLTPTAWTSSSSTSLLSHSPQVGTLSSRTGTCAQRARAPREEPDPRVGGIGAPLGGGVDLGFLEPPRVVDVDRLPLGEDVERRLAGLAVAVTRLLRPAERQMDLGADRARVDVRDSRVQVAHRAE